MTLRFTNVKHLQLAAAKANHSKLCINLNLNNQFEYLIIFILPDVGADELRPPQDGACLRVGGEPHRLVIDGNEKVARADATVPVDGSALGHRSHQDAAGPAVHHFHVDAQRIAALLDPDRPLQRRRQRPSFRQSSAPGW